MIELKKDIILYHGSYTIVDNIDLDQSESNKDFGKGFYVTSSKEQAISFIKLSINKAILKNKISDDIKNGYISIYRLKSIDNLKIKYFDEANIEWLHFVVANRDVKMFNELLKKYDNYNVFVGKIANDRTAATLQAYINGLYGEVGTEQVDKIVIDLLLPQKLDNQICFRTNEAIKNLEYLGNERYD